MRGINEVSLLTLQGMSLQEVIDFVESCGFLTEALDNEAIFQLAEDILDGHVEGATTTLDELDFSDV